MQAYTSHKICIWRNRTKLSAALWARFVAAMVRHEPLVSLDSWRGVLLCHHHLQDDRVTDAWFIDVGCGPVNWILFHGCWMMLVELKWVAISLHVLPAFVGVFRRWKWQLQRNKWINMEIVLEYFMAFATLKLCWPVFLLSHHLRIWNCTARTIRAVAAWQSKFLLWTFVETVTTCELKYYEILNCWFID